MGSRLTIVIFLQHVARQIDFTKSIETRSSLKQLFEDKNNQFSHFKDIHLKN